ncbi:MAG: bifunctional 4-hydroxy-2-oxoglutarate aldolase/2-dehydro-3-deoxy-phosphogluconate aldolase [Anaerolineales bacterium]|nr:MAG: bifunctional 4-hydroxy-2-oxoglutarate aldolase/2-dehydro-3-deoxy-phosphogluconate aldolase [Anaerolineales bacterium]
MIHEMQRIFNCGILPVVVIEDAKDAVPTAKALQAGGIDVIEITMRTEAGLQAIESISRECPDMLVVAGTVLSVEKCKACSAAGARGIVSPGFDEAIVEHCIENNITAIPGCVTPTEIQQALSYDLEVLKFFPANVYGGVDGLKALAGPFERVSFIPTGGVNEQNVGAFTALANVFAIGGSWVCAKSDITSGAYEKITELSTKARHVMMGFEFAHIGINTEDEDASKNIVHAMQALFGFPVKLGSSSNFAGDSIEVMKEKYLGVHGHLAIRTNNIQRAVAYLEAKGYTTDSSTAKFKNGRMIAIYLKGEISEFAVHLLQK